MRRGNGTRRWSGFLGALVLGVLCFPALSSAATVTYASNKVMGPTNGLVGYWTMNAQDINWTTNTILDRSGYGNNGTLTNMATKTSPVAGKLGQGLRFVGATTDRINAGSAASLDDITTLTVAFWVKRHSVWGYSTMVSKGSWQGNGWALTSSGYNSTIAFLRDFSGSDGMWESTGIPTFRKDAWTHVTLTYNKTSVSNTPLIYVNGVRVAVSTTTAPTGSANPETSYSLFVGADGGGVMGSFPGTLDDVRIYNRILTPSEITQVYKAGQVQLASVPAKNSSGLVGWWTFDGKDVNWTTSTALDRSGMGNNGVLTNMATKTSPVAGKLGQGLKFDGGDDAIDAGSASSLDDIDYLTVSAWIQPKTPGYSNSGNIIRKGENNSISSWAFGFQQGYLGSLGFSHAFSSTDGFWRIEAIRMNQWAHVVATYDRTSASNNPIFYVNGIATTTIVLSPPAGTASSDAAKVLYLGGIASANRNFDGSLDDVRIYNRILSATEVKQLYKEGQVTVTSFTCGVSTVKDVDGNVYNTLKIGTQCWMKQNMRVGTRINVATAQSNNSIIEKYCYDDNPANCTTNHPNHPDGGLYQWNEAMQYSTNPGARGICPAGWHIPTHDQWTTLERAICTSGSCATDFPYDTSTTGYRGTTEGTKLKANGTSGFEGNVSGWSAGGAFSSRSLYGYFWSSVQGGANTWARELEFGVSTIYRSKYVPSVGLSVRCLKD